jgi:hypothetical protein
MLGVLDLFWPPIVRVSSLETPFGFVIPLFTIAITRHYNHTQLFLTRLRVYTVIVLTRSWLQSLSPLLHRLHSLPALHSNSYCTIAHKVTYVRNYHHLARSCTGWLLSYQLLCRIITHTLHLNTSKLSPRSHSANSLFLTNSSRELTELSPTKNSTELNWLMLRFI